MPTFDVVSEVDAQEVRNAVDQASRELGQRYDFKGTDSSIELGTNEITLHTASEDRLTALKQLLEEKLVKRKVSLKALDYGKVEEASGSTVRQVVTLVQAIDDHVDDEEKRLFPLAKELLPESDVMAMEERFVAAKKSILARVG